MPCVTRCIFRWGLISALTLGGATLLIGPERVAAGLAHVRTKAQSVVDLAVDNPTALRRQLKTLAEKYPERIAKVRGEIAEVTHQLGQFAGTKLQYQDVPVMPVIVSLADVDGHLPAVHADRVLKSRLLTGRPDGCVIYQYREDLL